MLAHITYLSDDGMVDNGRRLQGETGPQFGFGVEFEVGVILTIRVAVSSNALMPTVTFM